MLRSMDAQGVRETERRRTLSLILHTDRLAAGHIILSVTRSIPYDFLEYHDKLGRCSLCRTDFYGARRLFFHYLDIALKERAQNG